MALPKSVDEARRWEKRGKPMKYVFFWGHRSHSHGDIGRNCLSQWWPAHFTVDGQDYASAEHYMMERKAALFGDTEMAHRILAATSPAEAKMLGSQVNHFDDQIWEDHRFAIVVAGNAAKFGQDPALLEFLMGTRSRVLVEASPMDRIWGIGLAADDERAAQPSTWRGLNLLGFALMEAREILTSANPTVSAISADD